MVQISTAPLPHQRTGTPILRTTSHATYGAAISCPSCSSMRKCFPYTAL